MLFNEKIIPYEGTQSIKLYQSLDSVRSFLRMNRVPYREEVWSAENETVPNPWTVVVIENVMSLFFARNKKLFKMVFWNEYQGALSNGISVGIPIQEAVDEDSSLEYDDWNEIYQSANGYWIEDDLDTKRVMSISIFIKELLDDDAFDYCKW